jgi:hypothetical protein
MGCTGGSILATVLQSVPGRQSKSAGAALGRGSQANAKDKKRKETVQAAEGAVECRMIGIHQKIIVTSAFVLKQAILRFVLWHCRAGVT